MLSSNRELVKLLLKIPPGIIIANNILLGYSNMLINRKSNGKGKSENKYYYRINNEIIINTFIECINDEKNGYVSGEFIYDSTDRTLDYLNSRIHINSISCPYIITQLYYKLVNVLGVSQEVSNKICEEYSIGLDEISNYLFTKKNNLANSSYIYRDFNCFNMVVDYLCLDKNVILFSEKECGYDMVFHHDYDENNWVYCDYE